MSFATQGDLEKFLQIDVTNEPDAAVTMLLENATGIIKSYVQRDLEETVYTTELYDTPEGHKLFLKEWPVTDVAALLEDGTALTVSDDYLIYTDLGMIARVSAASRPRDWRPANKLQAISVTYTAGYDFTTDPLVEKEAVVAKDTCTRIVARVFEAAAAYANVPVSASLIKSIHLEGSDTVTYRDSTNTGGGSGVTLAAPQLTESDKSALDPLRRAVLISG